MGNKSTLLIIGILVLITGLTSGYFIGSNTATADEHSVMNETAHDTVEPASETDEIVASDGVMQHMMDEMNRTLKGKSGLEFEESFLRGMIVHHLGAIDMAQELLNQTERPELITLANEIISTQTAEVETMKGWLEEWFGGN